jgi:aarF domain-containing kinase
MEWVEGQRLSDGGVTSEDLRMVEVGVYCSLSQLLDSGFYHADPHPGNLLRTPDGKLAYLGKLWIC